MFGGDWEVKVSARFWRAFAEGSVCLCVCCLTFVIFCVCMTYLHLCELRPFFTLSLK
jgi:hypothetical protein